MSDLLNPVIISVLLLAILSLARVNVIVSLILSALAGGLIGGLSVADTTTALIEGLGGQGEAALSYILLGTLAAMVSRSGLSTKLVKWLIPKLRGRKALLLFVLAAISSMSQTVVPVHIAFIPILIPPLLTVFNKMKIDRRAIATALTFGLKAPWLVVPLGFGLIFQGIVVDEMSENGMEISIGQIPLALAIPAATMVIGLSIAILFTYRKERQYSDVDAAAPGGITDLEDTSRLTWGRNDLIVCIALVVTLILQIVFESLIISALAGIIVIFLLGGERIEDGDPIIDEGVKLMGTIAFIILTAAGFANVMTETGGVDELVEAASPLIGDSKLLGAIVMMAIGLVVTMGIGSSFGTVPVVAAIFVPLSSALGFSPLATAALIGSSSALGDAGSPLSEITLAPSAGLNADGQHNHIWDTCVPTFVHFNFLFFIGGVVSAMIL